MSLFRLCLLGRLRIEGDSPELATLLGRRRLVAFLAVVGASGPRGVSRDTLLLYFWPESTASKARNSLNQALHAIRRDLGRDAILGTHDLRLNHAIITCDYADFISAAETEQFERAISLHRGRLLEGFSLANAPEWESWLAQERARETRVFCHAVEQLARAADKAGDPNLAAKWWCQLAEVEPLSSRAVTHAIRALAASGDRSGAISRGERYVRDVREEIDADPDRSVTELVNEVRRLTPRSSPVLAAPEPESSDSAEVPVFETAARNIGDRAVAGNPTPARPKHYGLAAAAAAALIVIAAIGWSWKTSGSASATESPPLVVVQKVSTPGADSADGMALAGLMAAAIDGVLGVRAVVAGRDDAADGNGTGRLYRVVTELVRQSVGPIRGSAVLLDSRTGRPIAWATSTDESGNVFGLVDDLTRQVLLNVAARELGLQSSAVVTPDLRALQAYLDGEGRLRGGHNAAALESFTRAITLDTGFAYAHYRLGVTAELLGRDRLARAAFDAASRSSASLPPFERTMIDAAREMRSGRPFEAEQLYREAVAEYPANPDAWRELAWSTFYNSPLRGRPVSDALPALRRVLEFDADDREALIYTARIASLEGRASEAARLSRRLAAESGMTFENRAFRFLALADPAGVKRVTQALLSTPSRVLDSMALESVVRVSPAGVERLARTLATPEPPRDAQGFGYRLLAQSLLARGRAREALIALDSAVAFDSAMALEVRALYVATPEFGYDANAVAATRAALSRWNPSGETLATVHSEAHLGLHGALREYLLGRLALRSSDVGTAERHAQALATIRADANLAARISTLEHSLRAHIEFARRNWAGAISELDRAEWPGSASALIAEAGDRFLRAMALEKVGRTEEARSWYASLAHRTSYELVYLGLGEYRLGVMAEARRDRRSAAAHFARVQDLYARGDTAALRLATEAARRLR